MNENYVPKYLPNIEEFPDLREALSNGKVKERRLIEDDSNRFILEKNSLRKLPLNELPVSTIIKFKVPKEESKSSFAGAYHKFRIYDSREGKKFYSICSVFFRESKFSLFEQDKDWN